MGTLPAIWHNRQECVRVPENTKCPATASTLDVLVLLVYWSCYCPHCSCSTPTTTPASATTPEHYRRSSTTATVVLLCYCCVILPLLLSILHTIPLIPLPLLLLLSPILISLVSYYCFCCPPLLVCYYPKTCYLYRHPFCF